MTQEDHMRVGLMGFGRAGRAVATILLESKETNLRWVIRRSTLLTHRSVPEFLGVVSDEPGILYSVDEFTIDELLDQDPVDAIVDFSSDTGLDYYAAAAAERGITIVSAVSLYSAEQLELLRRLAEVTTVMHSPNITLGINFLIVAARILKKIAPAVDIEIIEEHFKQKVEVSGTARLIAAALELPDERIKCVRAGGIIGVHEILFGFPYQTIRLRHESIGREAFGNGILFALRHLEGKPPGLYKMEDLLLPYFHVEEQLQDEIIKIARQPWWKRWPISRTVSSAPANRGTSNGSRVP
jgi:4-hydroxy-tetrahydrodipicolinate reductase